MFRKDRQKQSVISWLVLLVLVLAWAGLSLVPKGLSWWNQITELQTSEQFLSNLEEGVEDLKGKLQVEEERFESLAAGPLAQEEKIFPENIETGVIAKTLEFYALMAEELDTTRHTARFDLKRLAFSKTSSGGKKSDFKKTEVSLDLTADERNLETFVEYIQTGIVPERFKRLTTQPQHAKAYLFLTEHPLPIANVESIRLGDPTEDEKTSALLYSVQIRVSFYSR